MKVIINGNEHSSVLIGIRIDCAEEFVVVEDARPRDNREYSAIHLFGESEVHAVARNLPQELPAAAQCQLIAAQLVNLSELSIDGLVLVKEMTAP